MNITFLPTTHDDAEALVNIRINAMRESLERIGRFDRQRARERFLAAFDPAWCRFIAVEGERVGFVAAKPDDEHLALEHLYIVPEHQGRGIGSIVLDAVFADADSQAMPVKVGALRESDSNRFYRRHGFTQTGEGEWDIYYVRAPRTTP
ncbi:GNAT family N-acetyltransferase [Paraburkholderia sp. J12]|uniref:GNAT family N-acetyltransferase n=1 Tax=Paraburkholderia sp. J12 TaxID=2805432 RepID=UPI002ABEA19D|nr:GNAT family N-acetyltransferase [Paraburkholderia sp. J12]